MMADLFQEAESHDPGGRSRLPLKQGVVGWAEFSDCRQYRYKLRRAWDGDLPFVLWCLMNPSTADAVAYDDPTVAKCQRIARRLGYGGVWIANACAYRATDNKRLLTVPDPVGPRNHAAIAEMAAEAGLIVVAHGRLPGDLQCHADAMTALLRRSGKPLHVLRLTPGGTPMHPLARGKNHIPEDIMPVLWNAAA